MSLNSLQDDMSRRAASMAAMAKGARNPEQIQAIQKSLIAGVQSGAIKPYVGIPLIQELTNKLAEAKAKMAQAVTGAGMPQPPQGGAPIAQQVMAQAAQADQSQGVEALPSNLPQSYAGGGIIAFEDGGQVERYQNKGYTYETPYDRMNRENRERAAAEDTARLADLKERGMPTMSYGEQMGNVGNALVDIPVSAFKTLVSAPGYGFNKNTPPAVAPTATPAATGPIIPYGQSRANLLGGSVGGGDSGMGGGAGGSGGFKMPTMQTYTPTVATLPERTAPVLQDLNSFVKDLPENAKKDAKTAVDLTQKTLEEMDRPGFENREERLGKREAGLERENAISRALTGIKTGLRIAGSKERTLAGALGNEGSQGIEDLIRGEAANRAAKDKLEDYRDNLEQQKVASKKGNYQAAQAAGERAADNLYKYTSLNLNAASAGNSQALQRQQIEQTGDIGKANVANQGQQLQLSAVDQQNRNALGIAQLQATTASTNAQLQLGRERLGILKDQIAAGDKRAAAALATAEQKAYTAFQTSPQFQEAQAKAKKMAPIEAQRFMQQEWMKYSANAMPSLLAGQGGGASIPSFNDLYKATE
jgi:hypothetical protein